MIKKSFFAIALLLSFSFYSCTKTDDDVEEEKPPQPELSVVNISQETDWNYEVIGLKDHYYIKTNDDNVPSAVEFYSKEADKNYSIFLFDNGELDKVVVDDYIFIFRNFDGNKVDLGVIYPNGEIEFLRELETDHNWGSSAMKDLDDIEAWSDVVRFTSRVVSGVPCALSAAAASSTGGIATPLAVWACGKYSMGLSADVMENELDIHNGYTEFVNTVGNANTAIGCASGDIPGCLNDLATSGLNNWASNLEQIENQQASVTTVEGALAHGYGDVQVTLTWNTTSDIDLWVTEPNGNKIYYQAPTSETGGQLDVDDTDGFGPENIFWPTSGSPAGSYSVQVHYYGGSGGPTSYTVLIQAFGNSQQYQGTLSSVGDVANIATFNSGKSAIITELDGVSKLNIDLPKK